MILGIDLETYSEVPLKKAGLWKYVSSPSFEILLFAYKIDRGETVVVDLKAGEDIPPDIKRLLWDPQCIKSAWNAAFEWTCLGKYLGGVLPIEQWRDTMLASLYAGYPASLDSASKAWGLDEDKAKMRIGKSLIKYFCEPCAPTKINGGRTRNLPKDAPERWELFRKYNAGDVEAESEIRLKLDGLVTVPEFVQKQWERDLLINSRGVRIDRELVSSALAIDEELKRDLLQRAISISGLENPNSTKQLTDWLTNETDEPVTSLAKAEVSRMLASPNNSPEVQQMLELRQQLSKSSNKKYTAMEAAMCDDDRARGLLQFYGANRTGRWCLLGDHEVLTTDGWVRLDKWSGGAIAVYDPKDNEVRFDIAKPISFEYSGTLYKLDSIPQYSTPEHKMIGVVPAKGCTERRLVTLEVGDLSNPAVRPPNLRHITDYKLNPGWRDSFLKSLKSALGKDGKPSNVLCIDETHYAVGVAKRADADYITAYATLAGCDSKVRNVTYGTIRGNTYQVLIDTAPDRNNSTALRLAPKSAKYYPHKYYEGTVYCAVTRTGFFLTRRRNKVWITGNSGRLIQVQNLPKTHLDELDLVRELIKKQEARLLELLYGPVPNVLSQAIRTAFIPAQGGKFIDADFSAIEARVISWLAGETWRMEVFSTHGKIYEASASQMFGVPFELIKKGNPEYALRQKGKVAELALGYQGGENALIQMGALDMGIPQEDLQDIVRRWRNSNSQIVSLWNELEQAAYLAITKGGVHYCKMLEVQCEGNAERYWLTIKLPSGRKLYYAQPEVGCNRWGRPSLSYMGLSQTNKQWSKQETYGGKLVENVVQAIARDVLGESIMALEQAGYRVVFHIHDEVVIDADEAQMLEDVVKIMSRQVSWAPGLILNAEGWEGQYFKKD